MRPASRLAQTRSVPATRDLTRKLTRLAVPADLGHVVMLKASSLDAVDQRAPHAQLTNDFVER